MFIGVLRTYYEIYAVGQTEEETKENIIKGYKTIYRKEEREFENPTFEELNEYFGCPIRKVGSDGYVSE